MNIGELSGHNMGAFGAIAIIALLFGVLYAIFIYYSKDLMEGYASLAVVLGVLITLALSIPLAGLVPVLLVGVVFICTGTPMIVGEIIQHANERRAKSAELVEILRGRSNDGNNT